MSKAEPNVSVSWNGITFTAHASQGARFGSGSGVSEADATRSALKDLESSPDRTPPEEGGALPGASGTDPEKVAAVRAGRVNG